MSSQDAADLAALIAITRQVAAQQILPRFRNLSETDVLTKADDQDLVTIADHKAEADLTAAVTHLWPETQVIGEEAVSDNPALLDRLGDAARCVVIDPVDGTVNFASGIATFGVIIALVRNGVTRAGLLYDPVLDDWVAAVKGQGAWYQRPGMAPRALQVRKVADPAQAEGFAAVGFWDKADRRDEITRYDAFGHVRVIRCSCHEYRTLAFGRADFVVAGGDYLFPWDHAAGVLVAQEAGASVQVVGHGDYSPSLRRGKLLVAGDGALFDHFQVGDAVAAG